MDLTFPEFDDAELAELRRCLDSGWVTQGPMVAEFERLVAKRHHAGVALATTSCTAALHLAALALELGPGDEVVVPAFTWITSAHAAEYVGARAVFADVDPDTFNLDPAAFEAALTPRTRAVVAVHLFGLAAEMEPILEIARRQGLAVIEDAACAIGSTYRGEPVGALGDLGCFSFHPRKVVTTGEGGMVTTNRDDLAERIKRARNHGASPAPPDRVPAGRPYTMAAFDDLGFNLRLSDLQAAVGVAQMAKLDRLLEHRRECARRYEEALAELDADLARPGLSAGHTYQSYVVRLRDGGVRRRNAIMDRLAEAKIATRPGTHAVHRLGYYARKYDLRAEDFPRAAECEDASITLPLFPGMRASEQEQVVAALADAVHASD